MSNNQMVRAPRELLERLDLGKNTAVAIAALPELRELLAKPAEQHQGEPVAWRYQSHAGGLWYLTSSEHNAHTFKDNGEGGEIQALYTHADPAEVERLLSKREVENRDLAKDNHRLRAQLAERDALLQYTDDQLTNLQPHIEQACYPGKAEFIDNYVDPVIDRIRAISASAEPSDEHNGGTIIQIHPVTDEVREIMARAVGGGEYFGSTNAEPSPRTMSAADFVDAYCQESGISEAEFYQSQVPMPDAESPNGWSAISNNAASIKAHVNLHMTSAEPSAPVEQQGYSSALQGNYKNKPTGYSLGDAPTVIEIPAAEEIPKAVAAVDFATLAIESWTEAYRARDALRLIVEGLKPFHELERMPWLAQAKAALAILGEKEPRVMAGLLECERAAFEAKFPVPDGVVYCAEDNDYEDSRWPDQGGDYQPAWEGWQARAALERKP